MAFTFFMRDQPTLEHAADHLIPYASGRSKIRIWDAGCAMGQETYTIAMIFAEKMNPFGFKNLRIDATDYDQANNFGDSDTGDWNRVEDLNTVIDPGGDELLRDGQFIKAGDDFVEVLHTPGACYDLDTGATTITYKPNL